MHQSTITESAMMQTKLLLAASAVHLVSPLPVPTVGAIAVAATALLVREAYGWVRAAPAPLTRMAEMGRRLVRHPRTSAAS